MLDARDLRLQPAVPPHFDAHPVSTGQAARDRRYSLPVTGREPIAPPPDGVPGKGAYARIQEWGRSWCYPSFASVVGRAAMPTFRQQAPCLINGPPRKAASMPRRALTPVNESRQREIVEEIVVHLRPEAPSC